MTEHFSSSARESGGLVDVDPCGKSWCSLEAFCARNKFYDTVTIFGKIRSIKNDCSTYPFDSVKLPN